MDIRKNFEAVFLTAAALGLAASLATATAAVRPLEPVQSEAAILIDSTVHVVHVRASRLSGTGNAGLK
jgi:hypothetical protein